MTGLRTWTPEQEALVRALAGRRSAREITRQVNAVGPAHTQASVRLWAGRNGISMRHKKRASGPQFEWSMPEKARLRALVGGLHIDEVVATLNREFHTTRTRESVRHQARRLGLSTRTGRGLLLSELVAIFPVHNRQFAHLVDDGLLRVERRGNGQKGSTWLFLASDVEACIRAHPYLFDWRQVREGRWRDFVRAIALKDPYLSVREAAARSGVKVNALQRLIRRGQIPGVVTFRASRFAGYRLPLRAMDDIERLLLEGRVRREGAA